MRYHEFEERGLIQEMAKARATVTGMLRAQQEHCTDHILKVLCLEADEGTRNHWVGELLGWLGPKVVWRLKPDNRRVSAELVRSFIYDQPFGGNAVGVIASRLSSFEDEGYRLRGGLVLVDVDQKLRATVGVFASSIEAGEMDKVAISHMLKGS